MPEGVVEGMLLLAELGDPVGGAAIAHVSQHMSETLSREHLYVGLELAAHAQVCCVPSSGTSNASLPAASPLQAEQQLSQQFAATSGYAHLSVTRLASETAQRQFCSPTTPAIGKTAVVVSPLHNS